MFFWGVLNNITVVCRLAHLLGKLGKDIAGHREHHLGHLWLSSELQRFDCAFPPGLGKTGVGTVVAHQHLMQTSLAQKIWVSSCKSNIFFVGIYLSWINLQRNFLSTWWHLHRLRQRSTPKPMWSLCPPLTAQEHHMEYRLDHKLQLECGRHCGACPKVRVLDRGLRI